MAAYGRAAFRKLGLKARYQCLKDGSTYLGSRFHGSFHVHLFQYNGYYVEMWKKIGINVLYSIEIVNSPDTMNAYLDQIDLKFD